MTPAQSISLRPVSDSDRNFLFQVYVSSRMAEMALVNWTDEQRQAFLQMQFEAQSSHYATYFPQAEHSIIIANDQPVGRLYVDKQGEVMQILDIIILPEFGKAGIGTRIITGLLEEAAKADQPVTVYVESYNPSLRLFERLGFIKKEEEGVNYLMEWRPSPITKPEV